MILINSSPRNALKYFQPFIPVSVPVGIGFLISYAARHNIKIHCVDEQVEEDTLQRIITLTATLKKPYIFGFSVLTSTLSSALILSKQLKTLYPDSIIMFGGIHPTAEPDEILSHPHIDIVVKGEGEEPVVEFYNAVKNNKDYTQIHGISYKQGSEIIHNKRSLSHISLDDDTPFPYYLFTNPKYELGFVMSSRGCPYDCIFCSNRITTGKQYRHRPTNIIIEELKTLNSEHGVTNVGFYDDNFLVNKPRIYNLVEQIKKNNLHKKMSFDFQARADNVDEPILEALRSASFNGIFFGIETADDNMMLTIKKGETVTDCINAVQLAKKYGFRVNATFIYALPGDSHEIRMKCIALTNMLQLDLVRFNNATPYPGTELFNIAKSQNRLYIKNTYDNFSAVSTFIEPPWSPTPFAYVPLGNTEAEIRRDILYSYFSFYLNLTRLKHVFTPGETNDKWFSIGKHILPTLILSSILMLKFVQLFYYSTIKKETRISLKFFLSVFKGNLYIK